MRKRSRLEKRCIVVACVSAALVGLIGGSAIERLPYLDGLLSDLFVAAYASVVPEKKSRVIVIALDERSLRTDPINGTPRALLSPVWAEFLNRVGETDARLIAFDFIFAFDGQAFRPGYDSSFRRALFENRDRVVIGRSNSLSPAPGFVAALGGEGRVGSLELFPDEDMIVRSVDDNVRDAPKSLTSTVLSMLGLPPDAAERRARLRPSSHLADRATWPLTDALSCAETDPQRFRSLLADKVVFVGSTLTVEDRWAHSTRFVSRHRKAMHPEDPCVIGGDVGDASISGVQIHAALTDAVLRSDYASAVSPTARALFAAVAAAFGAVVGSALRRALMLFSIISLVLGGALLSFLAVIGGYYIALAQVIFFAFVGFSFGFFYRIFTVERIRTNVEQAFYRYLSPDLVNAFIDGDAQLTVSGDEIDVSVMFSDLVGFTSASEKLSPAQLVEITNIYLTAVANCVEAQKGYVDKFIGDGVMAFWNAPRPIERRQLFAMQAAHDVVLQIEDINENRKSEGLESFSNRIGLADGKAIVGNVGTQSRLNYTVMGATVNVAARLEALCGIYDARILTTRSIVDAAEHVFLFREVDIVTLRGISNPLSVFEPLGPRDELDDEDIRRAERYAAGFQRYLDGEFRDAAAIWGDLADRDATARVMTARAIELAADPPADWRGVWSHNQK